MNNLRRGMACLQMVLLVGMSFAIAGILGEVGVVRAVGEMIVLPRDISAANNPVSFHQSGFDIMEQQYDDAARGITRSRDWIMERPSLQGLQPPPAITGTSNLFTNPAGASVAGTGTEIAGVGIPQGYQFIPGEAAQTIQVGDKLIEGTTFLRNPSTGEAIGVANGEAFKYGANGWESVKEIPGVTPAAGNVGAETPGILSQIFGGQAFGGKVAGALFSGLVWGAIIGGASYFLAKMFGQTDAQAKAIGLGMGAGAATGFGLYFYGQNMGTSAYLTTPMASVVWGVGIAATIIILTYKKEKTEIVTFQCLPWEAPTGGADCVKCNENPLEPCSEYRCKSLGQACEIVNAGTDNELCIWKNRGDVKPPEITPWKEALKPDGLIYTPDDSMMPPNTGVNIRRPGAPGGCLKPFTPLEFGFLTDEPAQCKINYEPGESFDNMGSFYFGNTNAFVYNHTHVLKVPGLEDNGELTIHNDGTYSLYVRCMDANGNKKEAFYAFSFCVEPGPDTSEPRIERTSIESGSAVQFGVDSIQNFEVEVDKPSDCRWSRRDKDYDNMENEMVCAREGYEVNANLNYVCKGTLTGIKDREENDFYFRCKSYPGKPEGDRYKMTRSYHLVLRGTEPLTIKEVGPSGTIEGSTSVVTISLTAETEHGADEGKATCRFTTTPDDSSSYTDMEFTSNYLHNQSLDLVLGNYKYYINCFDSGGNSADASTEFEVFVDRKVPSVTRVYRDGDALMVVIDEEGSCAYSLTSCSFNFEEGLVMSGEPGKEGKVHFTEWDSGSTYYIKCKDGQGNLPSPSSCSVVAKGSEL